MPLIILSGFPCSGKTTRAQQLLDHLSAHKVHIVDDNHFEKSVYDNETDEKKARGSILSSVERYLTKNDVVIVDAMNYIKGLRYQLYCIARAIGTNHIVIHLATPSAEVLEWNKAKKLYREETLHNLIYRFEEPSYKTRWDTPLFTVQPDDAQLPFAEMCAALFDRVAPPPNLSTVVKPKVTLQSKDQVVQSVIQKILTQRREDPFNSVVRFEKSQLELYKTPTLHELKRLSSQFLKMITQVSSTLSNESLEVSFVEYLKSNLE